ncbi:MAG: GTP-binding protein HSR1, partial [Xanthomonadales bacterium]|nr:GTP-binding protein HSR1 [Xanthomonadales bacterium]NIN59991.1 GTP-binding protein HSR1 [Xanthomonadales bacterium]NIN74797.1 GTP-binding protein HSR1 [Xanthomonadales bacterium]NIO12768.1 GTP-binding protein HSR1 [Xanthomonadales bacterium]NIP12384.1 GTP-binding protein HSR1 [Xanthomonadales bacterium]
MHGWWSRHPKTRTLPDDHLLEANRNLRELLADTRVPAPVRAELSREFRAIEEISEKLRRGEIHIAAFGRVGTGKSSLLNALVDEPVFSTSPLHGETRDAQRVSWHALEHGRVELIDTPGIDELGGAEREEMATDVARRADILLMVCDGDLTAREFEALRQLAGRRRPLLLVLNKADRYTGEELTLLQARLA